MAELDLSASVEPSAGRLRFLVLGVGGGGVNTVSHLAATWSSGPMLAVADTDLQMLAVSPVKRQIPLGRGLTSGLSTGSNVVVGRMAAEESMDSIRELLTSVDVLFLVTALGGGTGGGASPVIANIAREENVFTIAFATLPFEFEGPHRMSQALAAAEDLISVCDLMIPLPNQNLPAWMGESAPLLDAFRSADLVVGLAVRCIWRLLEQTGVININLLDLRNLAEAGTGRCFMGFGEGAGPKKVEDALAALRACPALQEGRVLKDAPAVLVSLIGGPDLVLGETRAVMTELQQLISPQSSVRMGVMVEEQWRDHLGIVLLAAERRTQLAGSAAETVSVVHEKSGGEAIPKPVQESLKFEPPVDKGRFKNVEPTIYDGEDLDIPTFMRRGIKLSSDYSL